MEPCSGDQSAILCLRLSPLSLLLYALVDFIFWRDFLSQSGRFEGMDTTDRHTNVTAAPRGKRSQNSSLWIRLVVAPCDNDVPLHAKSEIDDATQTPSMRPLRLAVVCFILGNSVHCIGVSEVATQPSTTACAISGFMTTSTSSSASTTSRCSEDEVRKAAGSQSLERLQAAMNSGWTAQELDTLPAFTTQGKSPLQMAAWKGSIENVQYLVQKGCNVNGYSQLAFSYGKTPLFFAMTQSRVDVVEYFCKCPNIQVAIVNNKGQSLSSLAASHDMPTSVIQRIQDLEKVQTWWNFRSTHSDGLEYGDLDPRFLNRPLRDSDVVTELAVNPTTKQTRKGGFERRNPEAVKQKLRLRKEKQQTPKEASKKKSKRPALSVEEEEEWKQALNRLGKMSDTDTGLTAFGEYDLALLTVVRLGSKQRCAWMPQIVETLSTIKLAHEASLDELCQRTIALAITQKMNQRIIGLLEKLREKLFSGGNAVENLQQQGGMSKATSLGTLPDSPCKWKASQSQIYQLLRSNLGQETCQSLRELSIQRDLEHGDSEILCLPKSPTMVDDLPQILIIRELLVTTKVVAIDTEWSHNDESGDIEASTFQLAFLASFGDTSTIHCYVLDVRPVISGNDYGMQVRDLVTRLLEDSNKVVLGFSIGHDCPVLEHFVGRKLQPTSLLDLQQVLKGDNVDSHLPGLKACTGKFSNIPLSKEQQCSDWGHRPLSQAQLDYAGLDAAILLYLLAEYCRANPKLLQTTSSS